MRDLVIAGLEKFFKHVHPLPSYAFLHNASLFQRYNAGEADHALLLAILGINLQLIETTRETQDYGCNCIDAAENLVLRGLERPSISKIQTLVLVIRQRIAWCRFSSAFMLLATVARFSFALRLNYESPDLCFLAQESRRRLMWAVYMLDTLWAAGLQEFTLCPTSVIHLQLPSREEDFELDVPRVTEALWQESDSVADLGLLAYYIRITLLRDRILR